MTSDERLLQILEESRCLSKGQLLDYLGNTLYPEELRAVELHLASCELCTAALEGFEKVKDPRELLKSILPPTLPKIAPTETLKVKEEKAQPVQQTNTRQFEAPQSTTNKNGSTTNKNGSLKKFIGAAMIIIIGGGLIWWFELRDDHYPFAQEMKRDLEVNNENESFSRVESSKEGVPENQPQLNNKEPKKDLEKEIPSAASINERTGVALDKTAEKVEDIKPETAKVNTVAIGPQEIKPAIKESTSNNKAAKEKEEEKTVAAAAIPKKEEKEVQKIVSKAELSKDKAEAENTNSEKKEESRSSNASSDYEIGVALFKKKQFGSALVYLNSVESDKNNPHYWDALYYSAVCNKNLNNKSKAKKQLKQIIKAGVAQKSAAEQQLADLDSK